MLAFNASAAELSQQQAQLLERYTQLLSARENLQHSLALGELKQTEIADYRAWIQQLDTRVIQACQQLSAADKASLPTDLPCEQLMHQRSAAANININTEATEAEKTALIVDQLATSLGTFDEQLLQEQARIKAKTPLSDSSGGASGGGASGGADSGTLAENANSDSDVDGSTPSASESTANASTDSQNRSSESSATPGSSGRQGAPQKTSGTAGKSSPKDIPDGSDDDVVARQIREAAEKEKDPVLKEKLWEEYRRYKAGTG